LDFGLAKAFDSELTSSPDPANSPTLTIRTTQAAMIMGTPAYMSPEQASGQHVDKRADIWSFGAVLWEMLCGKPLFSGETVSHTLAAVLTSEPDWDRLPAETPANIKRLLRRCLQRDRRKRLRDIGDALVEIDEALSGAPAGPPMTQSASRGPWVAATMAAALLAAALAGVLLLRKPPEQPTITLQVQPPDGETFTRAIPAISPEGRKLAFTVVAAGGRTQLRVRSLDSAGTQT